MRIRNKAKVKIYNARWLAKPGNREKHRAAVKAWFAKPENAGKKADYAKRPRKRKAKVHDLPIATNKYGPKLILKDNHWRLAA